MYTLNVSTIFYLAAFFMLTELSRVLAVVLFSPIGVVNLILGTAIILSALCLQKGRVFLSYFYVRDYQLLTILLLVFPMLTLIYAPVVSIRALMLVVFYFFVLVAVYAFARTLSYRGLYRLLKYSLLANVLFGVVSVFFPDSFGVIAMLTDDSTRQGGRAFGFYMQPNVFGTVVLFHYLALQMFWLGRERRFDLILFGVATLGVLLSGSRINIVLWFAITVLLHGSSVLVVFKRLFKYGMLHKGFLMLPILFLVLVAFLSFGIGGESELGARLEGLSSGSLNFSSGGRESSSLSLRLAAQFQYLTHIANNPLLGHGLAAHKAYLESGVFFLSAHNTAINLAFQYGIPFLVLTYLWFVLTYLKLSKRIPRLGLGYFRSKRVYILLIIPLNITLNHGLFENLYFYVLFGLLLGVLSPVLDYRYDKSKAVC